MRSKVIRICSDEYDKELKLDEMMQKFVRRNYDINILEETRDKLLIINRLEILQPKSDFHKLHLALHNPDIIIQQSSITIQNVESENNNAYMVLPYSKIPNMKSVINDKIVSVLDNCISQKLKNVARNINMQYAFTIPNQLGTVVANIEKRKSEKNE